MNKFVSLKLANQDGRLSLSTLVLVVGVAAVFVIPEWRGLVAFIVAVLNWNAKRYYTFKLKEQMFSQADHLQAQENRVAILEREVRALVTAQNLRNR